MSTSGTSSEPQATTSPPGGIPGSQTSPNSASSSYDAGSSSSDSTSGQIVTTTFTSSVLTIITQPSTTFTSSAQTVVTTTISASVYPSSPFLSSATRVQPVCIGDGVDALAYGALAALLVPSAVGLLLWVRVFYRRRHALISLLHSCSLHSFVRDTASYTH